MSAYDSWFPEALAEPAGGALFLTRRDGVQLIVELVGEIDATNARVLVEQLREAVAAEGVRDLVVDLIGVEFCDVAGLRALLAVQKDALRRGAVCRFARPSPAITWLLHFGELEGVLAGIEPDSACRHQQSSGPG